MLSSLVYPEPHPRAAVSQPPRASISFCLSQPPNVPTIFDLTPSKSPHPISLPSCQQSATINPLAATLMKPLATVVNKELTAKLNPLDAALTRNTGVAPPFGDRLRPNCAPLQATDPKSEATFSASRPSTSVPRRIESFLYLQFYCSLGPTRIHSFFD